MTDRAYTYVNEFTAPFVSRLPASQSGRQTRHETRVILEYFSCIGPVWVRAWSVLKID